MFNRHIARRIWNHDRSVLEDLWREYYRDRESNLVRFVSALYSFREDALLRKKLLGMRVHIVRFSSSIASAEDCDVMSTVLEWLQRQPEARDFPIDLADYALRICNRGLRLSLENGHTKPLLLLTKARLIKNGRPCVEQAEALAEKVADPNQRARVFRKIGMLYRMNTWAVEWLWWKGFWWGIRAIFVPKTAMAVRLKSLAAFFVDR